MSFRAILIPFFIAIQFLTRFPTFSMLRGNNDNLYSKKNISRSLKYYPFIGFLIGTVLVGVGLLLQDHLQEHALYIAAIIVGLWIYSSGGLHLDGAADMADAWIGGLGDKQKTLDIMKDPVCGPFAVIAIVLLVLFKFVLVYEVLQYNIYILLLSPLLARTLVVVLMMTSPYVRENGIGSALNTTSEKYKNSLSVLLFAATSFFIYSFIVDVVILVAVYFLSVVFYYFFRRAVINRISGITGDIAGALIEYTEVVVLFVFVSLYILVPVL